MKTITYLIFSFLIVIPAFAESGDLCADLFDDCEFYACMETTNLCGERGYQLGYGRKYCLKFGNKKDKFSRQGQIWISETKRCLTEKLFDNRDESSCRSIKKQAFKDHVQCYFESGYCELSKKDKWNIIKIIGASALKPLSIKTGIILQNKCRKSRKSI